MKTQYYKIKKKLSNQTFMLSIFQSK